MRKIQIILLTLIPTLVFSQQASVEKQIFEAQIGLFGVWGHYEHSVQRTTSVRYEIGLDNGWFLDSDNTVFYLAPALSVEPRFYYNFDKRISRSKRIKNNSGNYLSMFVRFHPNWFIISNKKLAEVVPDISIIPSWGLKRCIGENFNFELTAGLGGRYYFAKNNGYTSNYWEMDWNFTVRFGYTF